MQISHWFRTAALCGGAALLLGLLGACQPAGGPAASATPTVTANTSGTASTPIAVSTASQSVTAATAGPQTSKSSAGKTAAGPSKATQNAERTNTNVTKPYAYVPVKGTSLNTFSSYTAGGDLRIHRDTFPGTTIPALRVDLGKTGGTLTFTGNAGKIGGATWKKGNYITVPFYTEDTHAVGLTYQFWENASSSQATKILMSFLPGFIVNGSIELAKLDMQTQFIDRLPGVLKSSVWGYATDPSKITKFQITFSWSSQAHTVWLGDLVMTDGPSPVSLPASPMVDEIGQWKNKNWPGKTADAKEMVGNLKEWAGKTYQKANSDFDAYGGYTKKTFEAKGYFYTHHDGQRWWLVDPAGHAFFSTGVNCVVPYTPGPVKGIRELFDWLPSAQGDYSTAWMYSGSEFSFGTANLVRAFGKKDSIPQWAKMTTGRLKEWGFNTVGNWSYEGFGKDNQTPYVVQMDTPTTGTKIFRDFPDVFSSAYQSSAKTCTWTLQDISNDPYCIGYFLYNEPQWSFAEGYIGDRLFENAAATVTKDKAIQYLQEKYRTPSALSTAWNHTFTKFDDLRKVLKAPSSYSAAAREDIVHISEMMIAEYIRVPSEAAKQTAPHHLNFGVRWGTPLVNDTQYAGTEYYDVFTINHYVNMPDTALLRRITQVTGKPLLIGEFHSGSLDRGLLSNGIIASPSQQERAIYYSYYVEQVAALPGVVGTHYFQLMDQPLLGRGDGENHGIGLCDVTHKPYTELIAGMTKTNANIYAVCLGEKAPSAVKPTTTVTE